MPNLDHFFQCLLLVHLTLLCSFVNLTSAQINIGDWISNLDDEEEASSTVVPTTTASTTDADTATNTAGGATIYKTTYQARYKHVLSEGCEGPNPQILVYCETGQLEMLEASDDSIFCTGPLAINGSTAALCRNDCVGAECESVYVDVGLTSLDLYGEITFACSGPDVNDVKAHIYIEGSDSGSCPAGTERGFNLMLASMGVLCNDGGGTNNDGNNEFVFDDLHAECSGGTPYTFTNAVEYQCLSGNACGSSACSVTIDNISISADPFRFADSCIESSDGSAIPEMDMPTPEPNPSGSYSVIFSTNLQVSVGQFFTEDDCDVHTSGLTVTCLNGNIDLLESPDYLTCQVSSSSGDAVDCVEANSVVGTPVNQWGNVVFECTSTNEIPTAIAQLSEVETTCTASSNLQLGALCGDPGEHGFIYFDFMAECGEGNDFDSFGLNYTCSESQAVSSFASEPGSIPEVSMYTDYRWSLMTDDFCFEFKQDSTGPGPAVTPTSPALTPAPQTAATPRPTSRPTAFPTFIPTADGVSITNLPTESPTTSSLDTVSPIATPTATPTATTTTATEPTASPVTDTSPVSTSVPTIVNMTTVPVPINREVSSGGDGGDSGSDSTAIIIGVVVAVVAVLAIVGIAVFALHKRNQNKKNAAAATVHKDDGDDDGNDDAEKGPEVSKQPTYGGMQATRPSQPPYGGVQQQQDGKQVLASYSLSPAEPKPEPGMTRPPPTFPFAAVIQNDDTSSRSPAVPVAGAASAPEQEQPTPARRKSQNYYKNKATPYDQVQVEHNDGALPTAAAVPMVVVDDTPMHPPNEGYFHAKNQLFGDSNLGTAAIADDENDDDMSC